MSGLRITGGAARGRVIPAPADGGVRPTSSRVREALFSILGQQLEGQRVLDAFGGTGLLAFEAWSRGASVTCVERKPAVAREIVRVARMMGAEVEVVVGDVLTLLPSLGRFDGVIADPPYDMVTDELVASLAGGASSWLVVEADAKKVLRSAAGGLTRDRARSWGGTALHVFWAE